jgi:hypothetical protein
MSGQEADRQAQPCLPEVLNHADIEKKRRLRWPHRKNSDGRSVSTLKTAPDSRDACASLKFAFPPPPNVLSHERLPIGHPYVFGSRSGCCLRSITAIFNHKCWLRRRYDNTTKHSGRKTARWDFDRRERREEGLLAIE